MTTAQLNIPSAIRAFEKRQLSIDAANELANARQSNEVNSRDELIVMLTSMSDDGIISNMSSVHVNTVVFNLQNSQMTGGLAIGDLSFLKVELRAKVWHVLEQVCPLRSDMKLGTPYAVKLVDSSVTAADFNDDPIFEFGDITTDDYEYAIGNLTDADFE